MDDLNKNSIHVSLATLNKDIELLHKEIDLTVESLKKWQNEQDRRIDELETTLKALQEQLNELTSRVDIFETKQQEYINRMVDDNKRQEEYKKFLLDSKRDSKALWIPIIFSSILTILCAFIPFLF